MLIIFDWYASMELVQKEFIETGESGNRRRHVSFEGRDLTPSQREIVVKVIGLCSDAANNVYISRQDITNRAVPKAERSIWGWVGYEDNGLDAEPDFEECIRQLLDVKAAETAARAYEREKDAEAVAKMRAEAEANIIVDEEEDI